MEVNFQFDFSHISHLGFPLSPHSCPLGQCSALKYKLYAGDFVLQIHKSKVDTSLASQILYVLNRTLKLPHPNLSLFPKSSSLINSLTVHSDAKKQSPRIQSFSSQLLIMEKFTCIPKQTDQHTEPLYTHDPTFTLISSRSLLFHHPLSSSCSIILKHGPDLRVCSTDSWGSLRPFQEI